MSSKLQVICYQHKVVFVLLVIITRFNHVYSSKVSDQSIVSERRVPIPLETTEGVSDDQSIVYEIDKYKCSWCYNNKHNVQLDFKQEYVTIQPGTCVHIMSDNYPNKYNKNLDYRFYYSTTHPDVILTISIPHGGLQISTRCHRDALSIITSHQTRAIKLCGYIRNFETTSVNSMVVRFKTNHKFEWPGYNGTICASEAPTTSTTTTTTTRTTTTTDVPIYCDEICGNLTYFSSSTARINDGSAISHKYPWYIIVDVIRDLLIVRCSGYLVSKHHVITSAYCFYQQLDGNPTPTVRLTAGEFDLTSAENPAEQVLYTTNVQIYPNYNPNMGSGITNVALVTIEGEGFVLNENVLPVCINDGSFTVNPFSSVEVGGFGWTSADYPVINMTMISLTVCPFTITPDLICLFLPAFSTPCHGDTGTPLIVMHNGRYFSVGHINTITNSECPLPGGIHPAVRLSFFSNWIDSLSVTPRMCNN